MSTTTCFHGEIRTTVEALLMSTHNICFCGEIRKIFTRYMYRSLSNPTAKCCYIYPKDWDRQSWAKSVDRSNFRKSVVSR